MSYETKDSGERKTFETGAQRDTSSGKGRYDLLPTKSIKRLADLYERGCIKYNANNWRKGIPISRCFESMIRHAFQALEGMDDEDHLAAVAWNAFTIMEQREMIKAGLLPPELDDIPYTKYGSLEISE